MRATKPASVFIALTVGFMGIYWAVGHAQEKGSAPYGPPPVLPPAPLPPLDLPKPAAPKVTQPDRPGTKRTKPDPTLIIPAAVYEEPRPIAAGRGKEEPARIVLTGATQPVLPMGGGNGSAAAPAPAFPVLPIGPLPEAPKVAAPPALPVPQPEPSKTLIFEINPKGPRTLPPPPALIPEKAKTEPIAPPPALIPERAKADPIAPPPALIPERVSAGPIAPPALMPRNEPPQGFVRIRQDSPAPPSVPLVPMPSPPAPVANEVMIQPIVQAPAMPIEPAAASVQCPAVNVEKRGPASVRAGETVSYQIVVRNLGTAPAAEIRIEDDLPANARFISAEPMPILQANKVAWTLGGVAAGQERQLRLTLQAGAPIQGPHRTSVQVTAGNQVAAVRSMMPHNVTNAVAMELIPPRQIAVGQPAVFEIRVVNHSSQPLTGLVLHGALPTGLDSPAGRTIEGEVGGALQPGEQKTLRMPTQAVAVGHYTMEARVTTAAGPVASAAATFDIAGNALRIQQPAATRLLVGQQGNLNIEIANPTDKAMRNVTISNRLPDGLECVKTTERGLYQANSRTVYWLIDYLPAGTTRTLTVRLYASKKGRCENEVVARADGVAPVQSIAPIVCETAAELSLRVDQKDRVVELGRETAYDVEVQNLGNAAASSVRVEIHFPPGLTPRNPPGRLTKTPDGGSNVVIEKVSLRPHEKMVHRLTTMAHRAGDQRVRFSVVSEEMRTPIQRETSTLVYRD